MALVVTDLQNQTQWALVAMPAPILLCACPCPASRLRTWRTGVGWCPFLRKRVIKLLSASFGPRPKLGWREQPTQILTSFGTDGDGCSDDGHTYPTHHPELVSGSIYSFWL
jgi:hypothetical protein